MSANQRRGFAMMTALLVLILVLAVLALLAGSLQRRQAMFLHEGRSIRLGALTDAGIALSLAELDNSFLWLGTSEPVALDGGTFDVDVTPAGTGRRRVQVDAAWRGGQRSVEVEIVRQSNRLWVTRWRRLR